jgi:two-component system, NtrC family, response regulator AtoC
MAVSEKKKGGLSAKAGELPPDEILFGRSAAMAEIRQKVQKVVRTDVPILIQGANGTGKGLLAYYIHSHSAYSSGAFVKVNCAAIPGALLEIELYGFEKGAFTGALAAKPGRIEMAHKGTLFLDEITDLDINLQSKLLQFLQDGRFSRLGGVEEKVIETRLICATNKSPEEEIAAGRFRADLFYRINVVQLRIPRLCERKEDIPGLAEYLRVQHDKQFAKVSEPLADEVLKYLQHLNWDGNVRELSNGIARYVLTGPESITIPAGPERRIGAGTRLKTNGPVSLKNIYKDSIREIEWNIILETLRVNRWNRRKTAKALKISYRALLQKIQAAGFVGRKAGAPGVKEGAEDRPI